jgi:hypothetical protein
MPPPKKQRGRPPMDPWKHWDAKLGTCPDRVIAKRARCSKCKKLLPASRIDHAAISRSMGTTLLCVDCVPRRFQQLMRHMGAGHDPD